MTSPLAVERNRAPRPSAVSWLRSNQVSQPCLLFISSLYLDIHLIINHIAIYRRQILSQPIRTPRRTPRSRRPSKATDLSYIDPLSVQPLHCEFSRLHRPAHHAKPAYRQTRRHRQPSCAPPGRMRQLHGPTKRGDVLVCTRGCDDGEWVFVRGSRIAFDDAAPSAADQAR